MKIPYKNMTISGDIGTGKTTLANNLAKKLGFNHINAGDFFRQWHRDNGIPLEKTKEVPEEVDRKIDKEFQERMQTMENTIFESRLAGFLAKDLPDVFKILCVTDFDVVMARVAIRDGISIKETSEKARERSQALEEKFNKLYGTSDYLNPKYFNLVVDTTYLTPKETLEFVMEKLGQ